MGTLAATHHTEREVSPPNVIPVAQSAATQENPLPDIDRGMFREGTDPFSHFDTHRNIIDSFRQKLNSLLDYLEFDDEVCLEICLTLLNSSNDKLLEEVLKLTDRSYFYQATLDMDPSSPATMEGLGQLYIYTHLLNHDPVLAKEVALGNANKQISHRLKVFYEEYLPTEKSALGMLIKKEWNNKNKTLKTHFSKGALKPYFTTEDKRRTPIGKFFIGFFQAIGIGRPAIQLTDLKDPALAALTKKEERFLKSLIPKKARQQQVVKQANDSGLHPHIEWLFESFSSEIASNELVAFLDTNPDISDADFSAILRFFKNVSYRSFSVAAGKSIFSKKSKDEGYYMIGALSGTTWDESDDTSAFVHILTKSVERMHEVNDYPNFCKELEKAFEIVKHIVNSQSYDKAYEKDFLFEVQQLFEKKLAVFRPKFGKG